MYYVNFRKSKIIIDNFFLKTQSKPETEEKEEVITIPPKEPEVIENKRILVPEHVQPEPEKRGFWSRFFRPYD